MFSQMLVYKREVNWEQEIGFDMQQSLWALSFTFELVCFHTVQIPTFCVTENKKQSHQLQTD